MGSVAGSVGPGIDRGMSALGLLSWILRLVTQRLDTEMGGTARPDHDHILGNPLSFPSSYFCLLLARGDSDQ